MADISASLKAQIKKEGPIPLESYMQQAVAAYYAEDDFLKDFVTAPEISQMFGELLAAWAITVWQEMGSPEKVALVELGPGRGTLMEDALRVMQSIPGFLEAADIHLVETSPLLKNLQKERFGTRIKAWHEKIETLPTDRPLIVIANEFFDAFPVRHRIKRADGWHEQHVAHTEAGGFIFVDAPDVEDLPVISEEGKILEDSPLTKEEMAILSRRIKEQKGAAIIIDYGTEKDVIGNSLQAIRAHKTCDVLDAPGTADITAHVHFADLKKEALSAGLTVDKILPQGTFLRHVGLELRAAALMQNMDDHEKKRVIKAVQRLAGPEQMGSLFKVMGIHYGREKHLPGFVAAKPAPEATD